MSIGPDQLRMIADMHAVYRMFDSSGRLLYVGLTADPPARFRAHAEKRWFVQVATIKLAWFPSRAEASLAERTAIASEHPSINLIGLSPAGKRQVKTVVVPPDGPITIREALLDGIFGTSSLETARRRVQRAGIEANGQRGDGSYTYDRAALFAAARSNRQKELTR